MSGLKTARLALNYYLISLLSFLWLLSPSTILAATKPLLISLENYSTTSDTSPKLSWQEQESCPPDTNISCFKIEVDDDQAFTSINKTSYTNSRSYSPILGLGTWYFRVKAKDENNIWSDYSDVWQFTIVSQPTPTPFSQATAKPSPSNPNSATNSSLSSFSISNIPAEILSSESFNAQIQMKNFQPNTKYFLKGAFSKSNSTNYFGKTYVISDWVKNSSTYLSQLEISTDNNGNFTGNLKVMPDDTDSGFSGTQNYVFKVARYNNSGSGPTWSNEITLQIVEDKTQEIQSKVSTANTAKSKTNTTQVAAAILTNTATKAASPSYTIPNLSDVAGISTNSSSSSKVEVQDQVQPSILFISLGVVSLLIGAIVLVYGINKG